VDSLNKILVDMMTTSEFVGRPRRWATGIELEEDPSGRSRPSRQISRAGTNAADSGIWSRDRAARLRRGA
ncbi:hypothetical protein ACWDNR_24455, partial [Gordonia aichiensis]